MIDEILKQKSVLSILRLMKNKKQLSMKVKTIDIFPLSKKSDLDIYFNSDEIVIRLDLYLNSLIQMKYNELISKEYANEFNVFESITLEPFDKNDLASVYRYNNEHNYFSLNFSDRLFHKHIIRECNREENYSMIFTDIRVYFQNFLIDVLNDWNLEKNNIRQCLYTGFYFRKNDVVPVDKKYKNMSHCHVAQNKYFKSAKRQDEQIYIYKNFVKSFGNSLLRFTDERFDLNNCQCSHYDDNSLDCECDSEDVYIIEQQDYNFIWVNDLQCCISSLDTETLSLYKIVSLRSNNNKLRSYNFPVHKHLPLAVLDYEQRQKNLLMLGIELEVNYRNDCKKHTIHKRIEENYCTGIAICKSDGSVNNGFEVNFVPMSLNYIKSRDLFNDFYNNVHTELSSYRSNETGVHVHLSRKALTRLQIGKIVEFVNTYMNRNYIVAISGRNPNQYTEIRDNLKIKHTNQSINFKKSTDENLRERAMYRKYNAVNLMHKDTIELRIFKGNLKPSTLYRYIEFAHSLANFVKHNSILDINYKDFIKFVYTNRQTYPFLNEFNLNYIGENDKEFLKSLNVDKKIKKPINYSYRVLKQFKEQGKAPKIQTGISHKIYKNRKIIKR